MSLSLSQNSGCESGISAMQANLLDLLINGILTFDIPVPAAVDVDSSELITTRHENNKLTHMLATRKALHKWSQQQYEASKVKTVRN